MDEQRYVVYAIPKNQSDDMTDGRGIEHRIFADLDSAEDYAAQQSSPDNPDRYEVRPEG